MCGGSHIVETNLSLDPDLIEMALKSVDWNVC